MSKQLNWIYDEEDLKGQEGHDASDPQQVSRAEKEAADRLTDLDYVLKEPRGRRFVWHLIHDVCHKDAISHVPGDVHTTAFNEGGRSVGEALDAVVRLNRPGMYLKMIEENLQNG